MALPAFAMMGKLDSNDSYFARLYQLFNYTKSTLGLYDSLAHLYYRDPSYIYPAKKTPAAVSLLVTRERLGVGGFGPHSPELPASDPARADYVTTFRQLSAALRVVQRSDGSGDEPV